MIGFYLAIGLGKLLSWLPFRAMYAFSNLLSFTMMHLIAYRKEVIMHNLRNAFPQKKEAELQAIRKGFYRNFSDIMVESLKSLSISEKTIRKHFKLKNPELFEQLYQKNRGVMLVMGHYNNFEWTAMSFPLLVPHPCFAVYSRLKNERFRKKVVQIREQFGLKLFPIQDTYPFMMGNKTPAPLYIFMADQSPQRGKIKYRTRFLNQRTPVHLGAENLARKCDLAVVFIEVDRVKRGYYEVAAHLLFEEVKDLPPYQVTDAHVQALENMIQRKPENWLWSHKRWKHADA